MAKDAEVQNPMTARRKLALIYRWSLVSALATMVLMYACSYFFKDLLLPIRTIYIFKSAQILLPFSISAWWNVLVFPVWFALLIPIITSISRRVRSFLEMGMNEIDFSIIGFVAFLNALIGLLCFWLSYAILSTAHVHYLGILTAFVPSIIAVICTIVANFREGGEFLSSIRNSSIFLWLGTLYSIVCGMIISIAWSGLAGMVLGISCMAGVLAAELVFLAFTVVAYAWIIVFRFARGTYRGEGYYSSRLLAHRRRFVDWLFVRKHVHTND
jgi:hypothetical protein